MHGLGSVAEMVPHAERHGPPIIPPLTEPPYMMRLDRAEATGADSARKRMQPLEIGWGFPGFLTLRTETYGNPIRTLLSS